MGASKKFQMKGFDTDWPNKIWNAAKAKNDGKGAGYLLPLAAIALTGCRPAALEKGIEFHAVREEGITLIVAKIKGTKAKFDKAGNQVRGQPEITLKFDGNNERIAELLEIVSELRKRPGHKILISYDAEAISTRLRELSKTIWPRRKNQITAYCYRELFSSQAKGAEVDPEEIAAAMGHLSTESQGKYSARSRKSTKGGVKPARPFKAAEVPATIRAHRSPMSRFKNITRLKKIRSSA